MASTRLPGTAEGPTRPFSHLLERDVPEIRSLQQRLRQRAARGQASDRLQASLERLWQTAAQRATAFRAQRPVPHYDGTLPIHAERERIVAAIRTHPVLVLCGETGSGKTTQLPKFCLDADRGWRGQIGHTQPRRIAARSVASRIAEELGCPLGTQVGYSVRFADVSRDDTHIRVLTDGLLLAELRQDPDLLRYDTLVIDEAHERSLNIDFLLGYVHRLLPRRPDLRVILTSATLDPQRLSAFFAKAPILEVPGRSWPVEIRYRPLEGPAATDSTVTTVATVPPAPPPSSSLPSPPLPPTPSPSPSPSLPERDLLDAIGMAVTECCREGPGDILIFLPGEREIRDAAMHLRRQHPPATEILPLYARLSIAEQNRVFHPAASRRIVLATNVAETALTVPGIRFVIDTGLGRLARYSWRSRLQRLSLEPIAQASAIQRAGRCGRVGPGLCLRLYSAADFQLRPAFTDPEILRTSLAAVILQMAELGLGDPRHFPFIDAPDPRLIRDGYRMLEELQAVDRAGHLTPLGHRLARLPMDPRLGAMILAGAGYGILPEVVTIATFLALQDPRERPVEQAGAADAMHAQFRAEGSDFLGILNLWDAWHQAREEWGSAALKRWCRQHFLAFTRMREWQELRAQTLTLTRTLLSTTGTPAVRITDPVVRSAAVHKALLTGLITQIGRKTERRDYLGVRNRHFQIHPGSSLAARRPPWIFCAEILETTRVYAREVAQMQPEWVLEVAPLLLQHEILEPHFQARDGRIGAWDRVTLYGLVIAARLPVNYARSHPAEARALFLREGLVAGGLRSPSPGLAANRALVREIEELEIRGRRRDLLATEDRLLDFYAERLPEQVVDGPSFAAWSRPAEQQDPDLLRIPRARLLNEPERLPRAAEYPDHLELEGLSLPLTYRFEPGHAEDGVTVSVPLVALSGLPATLSEWIAPGLRLERVIGLLRTLPKHLRRDFVPVPEFAAAVLARLPEAAIPLRTEISAALQAMTGTPVPLDAWQPERLEPHLRLRFRVLDAHGQEVASGRDLAQLQRSLAVPAATPWPEVVGSTTTAPTEHRAWDFGPLPETLEIDCQGARIRSHPVLVDGGDHVRLEQEAERWTAATLHHRGLCRLFLLGARQSLRELRRHWPELAPTCLLYAPLGSCTALREQIFLAAAARVFLGHSAWPRDADTFAQTLTAHQGQLFACVQDLAQQTTGILTQWTHLRQRLAGNLPLSWIEAARDIHDQLAWLVPPDVLLHTPPEYWGELPRYLLAIDRRLQRLERFPDKDRRWRVDIEPLWTKIRGWWERSPQDPAVLQLRFRLEELRVSLFAQELGTREKVSVIRLARELRELPERIGKTPPPRVLQFLPSTITLE